MFNIRTDLAIENREVYNKARMAEDDIEGINTSVRNFDGFSVTEVDIMSLEGAKVLDKPVGKYFTLEADNLYLGIEELNDKVADEIASILRSIITLKENDTVLVVGLGNKDVTPDAIGPNVIAHIDVTRHLIKYVPQYIKEGTKSVSAIAPGVLATTGIETLDIIKSVVKNVNPTYVLVVDALCAKNIKRIKTTIQISDAGICPGAGVGNNRERINKDTLGVPVIALGVPTVVDFKTIVGDVIESMIENNQISSDKIESYYTMISQTLPEVELNNIVTPNEIDDVVTNFSKVLANGINIAINP